MQAKPRLTFWKESGRACRRNVDWGGEISVTVVEYAGRKGALFANQVHFTNHICFVDFHRQAS